MIGPGPGAAVVDLHGVVKAFAEGPGAHRVLDGVELSVAAGEIVAIAGRSGSGKTTLLTIVAGLEPVDAGDVLVLGAEPPVGGCSWQDVAILPQSLGLLDELTIAENIGLPLRLGALDGAAEPLDLMEALGIAHLAARFPSEVSLGEQQRAGLARAAVVRPRVLLADEPVSHQNEAWARTMVQVLDDLSDWGTTCLLATHDEIAFGVAARVLELHRGSLRPLGDR